MSMFGKRKRDERNEILLDIPDLPVNTSYFGKHLTVEGNITGNDNLHIDGKVEGNIETEKEVKMNTSAIMTGDIKAHTISSSGVIKGNITARDKLCLDSTAKVNGKINTPSVSMKEGVVFDGEMDMDSKTRDA